MRTKCDEQLIADVCKVLEAGNFLSAALEFVGITGRTFNYWFERGEIEIEKIAAGEMPSQKEKTFVQLVNKVRRARSSAEVRSVMLINTAAKDDWRAAAWYLERSKPERWGRQVKTIEHSGTIKVKETVDLSKLSEEALLELESAIINED